MMADHHQVFFLRLNSTKLNDDDYSLSQLAQDMQIQMHLSQAEASVRSPFRQQRSDRQTYGERPQQYRRLNYGGRGFNYGGRSSWRPNYGQGYSSNNFGPYQGGRGFSNNYQSGRSINYNSGRGFGRQGYGGQGGFQQGRNNGDSGYNQGRGNAGRGGFGQGRGNGYND